MNLKQARKLDLGDECLLTRIGPGLPVHVVVVGLFPYDPRHARVRFPSGRVSEVTTTRLTLHRKVGAA